jgi:hypothetical protein
MGCNYIGYMAGFLEQGSAICRGPTELGVDEIEPERMFPDTIYDRPMAKIEVQFQSIGKKGSNAWNKKSPRIKHRDVVVTVIKTIPVIWHNPKGKQDRADDKDLFEERFEVLNLVFDKKGSDVPVILIRIIRCNHQ